MLESLFSPKAVAVIGASANPSKLGYTVLDNIIKYGFEGQVYPINPKEEEILERTCYPSVSDVPGPVDLAVVVARRGLRPASSSALAFGRPAPRDGNWNTT